MFLQDFLMGGSNCLIVIADKLRIEAHFLRYLHLAIFDHRPSHFEFDVNTSVDLAFLLFIITPLFVIGMRYFTAPVYLDYTRRLNSMVAILAMPVILFGFHIDIKLLGVIVFIMNACPFYYHMDPPQSVIDSKNYR